MIVFVVAQPFRKAKVYELDVAFCVEEEVFRLHVPVGDAALVFVQVFEHEDDFSSIKPGHVLVETAVFAEVGEELAAGDVVEEDIQKVMVGEGGLEGGDEGVA